MSREIESFVLGFRIAEAIYNKTGVVSSHAEIMEEAKAIEGLDDRRTIRIDPTDAVGIENIRKAEALIRNDGFWPAINMINDRIERFESRHKISAEDINI